MRQQNLWSDDHFIIVSKILPRGVVQVQGRVLLQAAGEWRFELAVQKVVWSPGSERSTRELEARSSEKVSKKTQGKGEEHPQRLGGSEDSGDFTQSRFCCLPRLPSYAPLSKHPDSSGPRTHPTGVLPSPGWQQTPSDFAPTIQETPANVRR